MLKSDTFISRVLGWITTPFYVVFFFGILCFFHPVHMIARIFGSRAHKHTLDLMDFSILFNMHVTSGAKFHLDPVPQLDTNRPLIIVSNHQSMYDIPMLMVMFRKREVGFISKKELAKGIPSISYSLRKLDSALIDRSDPKNAINVIETFGQIKEEKKQVASIFPEGTRARDGKIKTFKSAGFEALMRSMPSAQILPIAIDGNWEFLRFKFMPVPYGVHIHCRILPVIDPAGQEAKPLLAKIEAQIREEVSRLRAST